MSQDTQSYLSVEEVAEKWGVSRNSAMRILENEPGVIIFRPQASRFKRIKRLIRVPSHVVDRIERQAMNQRA